MFDLPVMLQARYFEFIEITRFDMSETFDMQLNVKKMCVIINFKKMHLTSFGAVNPVYFFQR